MGEKAYVKEKIYLASHGFETDIVLLPANRQI
jgi:hypothetical protein